MKLKPITDHRKQPKALAALEKLARHLGPGERLPRVRELAQSLGLTVATLDQALRQAESRGLIVRRPRSGVFVSSQIEQKSIGLVFGRNIFSAGISPFYGQLIERCQQRASEHNERFSFFLDIEGLNSNTDAPPVHRDLVSAVDEGRVDGLVLACRGKRSQEVWLRAQGIPLVVFGETDLGPGSVSHDREAMIRGGLDCLAKMGCNSLGILGAWHRDVDTFARLASSSGPKTRQEWLVRPPYSDDQGNEGHEAFGYESIRTLLRQGKGKRGHLPSGLVITNDVITRGACIALNEAGLELGRDIHIATHANKDSSILREWSEHLALAEFDTVTTVEAIFQMLEDMMSSHPRPQTAVTTLPRIIPFHP